MRRHCVEAGGRDFGPAAVAERSVALRGREFPLHLAEDLAPPADAACDPGPGVADLLLFRKTLELLGERSAAKQQRA